MSKDIDSYSAGKSAAENALAEIAADDPDVLFVFSSIRFDQHKLLQGIKTILPDTPLVGCTDAGEITSNGEDKKSVIVLALKSNTLKISTGLGRNISADSRAAGQEVAHDAITKSRSSDRDFFMIFPDGLKGNTADLIRGCQEVFGTSFPIVGGCAADDFLFTKTYQFYEERVYTDSVPGVLFSGNIAVGIGARHGWYPIGKPLKVTKAEANIIHELAGRPAAKIYEDYFGKRVIELRDEPLGRMSIMYPLGMTIPGEEECIVRNALSAERNGALICAGEVPEGAEIRVMMGSRETALKAAKKASEIALEGLRDKEPRIVFVFDSVSRHKLFGRMASLEVDIVQEVFGRGTPIVGFYTYGEQAPLGATINLGQTFFHNETIVVVAIGE
ncbi:MAG: FIST N-terminal domain-containing protein [Candidatus Omnitrophota bacterium]